MAHSYSTSLNYLLPAQDFTVHYPLGRLDMALFLFTKAIKNKKKIKLFNGGKMIRDFTYIDDVAFSLKKLIKKIPNNKKSR